MPITNPAGDPTSWDATVERASNGVGTTTFWPNTFDKLLNRTAYLYDQLLGATNGLTAKLASTATSSSGARLVGAEAHTGANGQGNYLAQTLFALLGKIWDEKGGLAAANVWTGANSRSGTGATFAERVITYDPAATTATIGAMADIHFVDGLTHTGDTVYTLQSTGTVPPVGARIRVVSVNMNIGKNLDMQREGGASIVKFTGGADHGWADFEFVTPYGGGSASWRYAGSGGSTTITIANP